MKKYVIITLGILLVAGMLAAQGKDYPQIQRKHGSRALSQPMPEAAEVCTDMMKELNLTEAQNSKITQLQTNQKKAMNSVNAEIENLRIDMNQALKASDFKAAQKLNDQLHEKMRVKSSTQLEHKEQILKELTPEQREKFQPKYEEARYGRPNGRNNPTPSRKSKMTPMQNFRHTRRVMQRDLGQ
ncbi:MAG: hypothetical protein GX135_05195 [Candidatus Cloacimonetes bacterium]|jgi:Spy/CpxP family protein refolding chaperone|nr:hypothetical protein [Candidatus Cloacimonadota bacterium]